LFVGNRHIKAEVIMSFNWWKRHEEKPLPKSHFPIKVKIEQNDEVTVPGSDDDRGEFASDCNTSDVLKPSKEAADCSCNEGQGVG
jgi:hypothetical protein